MNEFKTRREQLIKQMGPNSIAIIVAAREKIRNWDNPYPYRQDSHFYYLTGFNEPEAVAVLVPGHADGDYVLFNRPRDPARETWDGPRAGQAGAVNDFGADKSYSYHDLDKHMPALMQSRKTLYYDLGAHADFDQSILQWLNRLRGQVRRGVVAPSEIRALTDIVSEMRQIKSAYEIECMRHAANVAATAHQRLMQITKPGLYEYELEAELMHTFIRMGCRFPAYQPIIASGKNTCILHYNNNNALIENNTMVLVDAGAEYQDYASDITRSYPSNGKFSPQQKAIYEVVLHAQQECINLIKPGLLFSELQITTIQNLVQGLMDIGILKGNVDELIEKRAFLPFYMHSVSHWLGLDTHDVGAYYDADGQARRLESGMVLTVEPGLYCSANIDNLAVEWHDIGVRIEDDVLVTENGFEVLSHAVPKTISEIEDLMRDD